MNLQGYMDNIAINTSVEGHEDDLDIQADVVQETKDKFPLLIKHIQDEDVAWDFLCDNIFIDIQSRSYNPSFDSYWCEIIVEKNLEEILINWD